MYVLNTYILLHEFHNRMLYETSIIFGDRREKFANTISDSMTMTMDSKIPKNKRYFSPEYLFFPVVFCFAALQITQSYIFMG